MSIIVSIITPCLNSEKTIERTIRSVLNQSCKNIEYIIIDGKSSDKTVEIIQSYAEEDSRLKFVSQKDNSMTEALNRGLQMATGEIIASINADDWYEKDAIEHVVKVYELKKFQCLVGNTRFVSEDGNVPYTAKPWICPWKSAWHLMGCMTPESSVFYSRECLMHVGNFNENIRYTQDFELYLRILSEQKITYTNKIISNFYLSEHQYSNRLHEAMEEEVLSYISTPLLRRISGGTHLGSLLRIISGVRAYSFSMLIKHFKSTVKNLSFSRVILISGRG